MKNVIHRDFCYPGTWLRSGRKGQIRKINIGERSESSGGYGEGERAVEPGDMHAFVDWSNVFMLTDSRCC